MPAAPPVRMLSSQRSFHTQRSGYYSELTIRNNNDNDNINNNVNGSTNQLINSPSHDISATPTNADADAAADIKVDAIEVSPSAPVSTPSSANLQHSRSSARKLRYSDSTTEVTVTAAAAAMHTPTSPSSARVNTNSSSSSGNGVHRNMDAPTKDANGNNKNNTSASSLRQSGTSHSSRSSAAGSHSARRLSQHTRSHSQSRSLSQSGTARSVELTHASTSSSIFPTAALPKEYNASLNLAELQAMNTLLDSSIIKEENKANALKVEEKLYYKQLTASLSHREWIQAEVNKDKDLHNLTTQCRLIHEREITCTTNLELLRQAIPRCLLKVLHSSMSKQELRSNQSLLTKYNCIGIAEVRVH